MIGRALALVVVACCLLCSATTALAQAPQVVVNPSRQQVEVGETFWVTITVTSQMGGASLSLPAGSAFELMRRTATSTMQFSVNLGFGGQSQIQESHRWLVRALRPGSHTFGPLIVTMGGRQHRAGSATIQVGGSGTVTPIAPQPQPGPQPAQPSRAGLHGALARIPGQIDADDLGDGAVFDPELFLRADVEPRDVYVGQQVMLTLYLYTAGRLRSTPRITREPSTDGFWSEDLETPRGHVQQFVGQNSFTVYVLRQKALFPLRTGNLTVGAAHLTTTRFQGLFSRGLTLNRASQPLTVRAKALPQKGRPTGFFSGNVGRYSIATKVDRPNAKVGEPLTYAVTVRGRGNLRNLKLGPLDSFQNARVYDSKAGDKVVSRVNDRGIVVGERTWEYLVMPQKEGELILPPQKLVYFDPHAEQYRVKSSQPLAVQVEGRVMQTAQSSAGGAEDESPQRQQMGPLRSIRRHSQLATAGTSLHTRWWFLLLLFVPPLGFVSVLVVQTVRRRRYAAQGAIRSRKAASNARKELNRVAKEGGAEATACIMRALNGYFEDRFGEPTKGLTKEELKSFLHDQGVSEELAVQVASLLDRCERLRYAGGAGDEASLATEAAQLIGEVDSGSRKAKEQAPS